MYESFLSNSGKTVDHFPAGINDFTLSHSVQIDLGLTQSHVLWLRGYISRDKAARA